MTNFVELDDGTVRFFGPTDAEWDERKREAWARVAPRRFVDATLDDAPEEAVADLLDWDGRSNVLIAGPVGSGKTHLAFGLARRSFWQGRSVRFAPVVEALDNMRPGGKDHQVDIETVEPWVNVYANVDVLILDDLGGEKPTDWTAERLYLLVNRRWLDERPVIATTNMTMDQLKEQIGDRTYDRLRDGAVGVLLSGESHRRPA